MNGVDGKIGRTPMNRSLVIGNVCTLVAVLVISVGVDMSGRIYGLSAGLSTGITIAVFICAIVCAGVMVGVAPRKDKWIGLMLLIVYGAMLLPIVLA